MTCSKSAGNTLEIMRTRQHQWHMCHWHRTDQCPRNKQRRKQIAEIMTSSKSTANAWELSKRDSINGYVLLTWNKSMSNSKQRSKRLAKAMNCSKSAANTSESCKRDDISGWTTPMLLTLNRWICSWGEYGDLFTILTFSMLCVEICGYAK